MKQHIFFKILVFLIAINQHSLAQVDVVYKDLVWSDEFESNGAINTTNWHHQTQIPAGGNWYNNEVQHYTNRLVNSFVSSGNLYIVAKKESFTDQGVTKQYTSARLNSKFAYKYGRVDIRAKIPKDLGTWPALWLLGKNINEDGGFFDAQYGTTAWPACGEIDILEHGITRSKPDNYIQSAIHSPSSFGNTVNIGGVVVGDNIADNYHIYSMNWSPNQISFLLDGVVFYTYNPSNKTASTWPFDDEHYLLLNIAMGGIAGNIPSNFSEATMQIDYIRVYQNTTPDSNAPTNFTASLGKISGTSVELLLNADDDSGNINYNVLYGMNESATTNSPSGILKSFTINNLAPKTKYSFSITASDVSKNNALNSAILLDATTTEIFECSAINTESSQGVPFSLGYNYSFETIGTDVKISFELLDTDKTGVIAYLWRQTPFSEVQMKNEIAKKFTHTLSAQNIGTTIHYACKFAFAGGLSVTKYLSYKVGDACSLKKEVSLQTVQYLYPNPVDKNLAIYLKEDDNQIVLTDSLGRILIDEIANSYHIIDMSSLKSGLYFLKVSNAKGSENLKVVKK